MMLYNYGQLVIRDQGLGNSNEKRYSIVELKYSTFNLPISLVYTRRRERYI